MLTKAIVLATTAHSKQTRKGTEIPYILHPLEAGIIVSKMKYKEDLICAAILHDIVEEVQISIEAIKEMFNGRVAELVRVQSEDKSKTWEERKQHTVEYLKSEIDEDIKIVCLGDKLSNMRAIYQDHLKIGDKLWERFNVKDKAKQGQYYIGLAESLNSLNRFKEYQEFNELITTVFRQ